MRTKPENTDVSDDAWERFDELAAAESIGESPEDWMPWFRFFETGFVAGLED